MYQTNPLGFVGYKNVTPSGPTLSTLLVTLNLFTVVAPRPSVFATGNKGNNMDAVVAAPINFKKSSRDTILYFTLSIDQYYFMVYLSNNRLFRMQGLRSLLNHPVRYHLYLPVSNISSRRLHSVHMRASS